MSPYSFISSLEYQKSQLTELPCSVGMEPSIYHGRHSSGAGSWDKRELEEKTLSCQENNGRKEREERCWSCFLSPGILHPVRGYMLQKRGCSSVPYSLLEGCFPSCPWPTWGTTTSTQVWQDSVVRQQEALRFHFSATLFLVAGMLGWWDGHGRMRRPSLKSRRAPMWTGLMQRDSLILLLSSSCHETKAVGRDVPQL